MKRKIVSLFLVVCMAAGMTAGCQNKDNGENQGSAKTENTDGKNESGEKDTEEGDPYTVAIKLVNIAPDMPHIEMVEEAVNEISVPAINCRVDIQNHFIGDLPTNTSMGVAGGEKLDVICVGQTQKLADISDDGILMPLDDYLQYAPDYVELVKEYMAAGQVDGIQYALPTTPYVASGTGLVYNKDMAENTASSWKKAPDLKRLQKPIRH